MSSSVWTHVVSAWLLVTPIPGPTLATARQAFDNGDFDVALRTASTAEATSAQPHERAQLELLIGRCHAAMGNLAGSSDAFRAALGFDPTITLDPTDTAPDLIERLEGLRSTLRGDLSITTDQLDVRLRIDDQDVGPAPYRGHLKPGPHLVEAVPSGASASVKQVVTVRANEVTQIALSLNHPIATTPTAAPGVASLTSATSATSATSGNLVPGLFVGGGCALVVGSAVMLGYSASVNSTALANSRNGTPQTVTKSTFDTAGGLYYTAWPVGVVGLGLAAYGVWGLLQPGAPALSLTPVSRGAVLAWGGSL